MPPKKPVLTKAQQKKLDAELKKEAEEKARKEEEARQAALKKKREEEEQKRREEEELFNAAEKERLKSEENDYMQFEIKLSKAIPDQEKKFEKELEWKRYINNHGLCNVYDVREVNELKTSFRDAKIEKNLEIEPIIKMMHEVQLACHELAVLEIKYRITKRRELMLQVQQDIAELQSLTIEKMQEVSYHICMLSDSFMPVIDPNIPKEEIKKTQSNKNDSICYSRPDVRVGFLINFLDKTQAKNMHDFTEAGIRSTIPMTLKTANFILRAIWTNFDYMHTSGYNPYMVVGGVLGITTFDMPQVPGNFKQWKIKHVIDKEAALTESSLVKNDQGQKATSNQVKISYRLSPNIFLGNNFKKSLAIWNYQTNSWQLDSDMVDKDSINFTHDHLLEFQTYRLSPIAFLQSRAVDFPYKSWKLRSISENDVALLDIEGKRLTFKFEIGHGYVKLRKMLEKEFNHLYDKEFEPEQLLYELYKCGVNLMPIDADADQCGITPRSLDHEEKAINDLSTGCRAYYFKSSRWASHAPKGSCCFTQT